jgi:hypothetical protein
MAGGLNPVHGAVKLDVHQDYIQGTGARNLERIFARRNGPLAHIMSKEPQSFRQRARGNAVK